MRLPSDRYTKGFTIIELIVTVVVISILAAVTIVSYGNWRTRVAESEVKSDLASVSTAMQNNRNFKNAYPLLTSDSTFDSSGPSANQAIFTSSPNVLLTYATGDASSYCIDGRSRVVDSVAMYITESDTDPKQGSCGSAFALDTPMPSITGITHSSLTVSWQPITGATDYVVKYGISSPSTTATCSSSPCLLSGLASSTTYKITVTAKSLHNSVTSAVINGTTISFIAVALETGGSAGCEISSGNQAFCWGYNSMGQLGNGTTTNSTSPVAVDMTGVLAGKTITSFALGSSLTCAIASDNQAYCWGGGMLNFGSLGNGTTDGSTTPVAVDTSGVLAGKTIKSIYAGGQSACVIASDNKLYCWGENATGKLGNGTNTHSSSPIAVSTSGVLAGKTIKSASMGSAHMCAIASDNLAYCWGANANGQLGNGTTTSSTTPVAVTMSGVLAGKTIKSIAAAASSTCAIASDNLAYCWGYNSDGQLGNGNNTSSSVPVAVSTSGVLAGKTMKSISRSSATCAIASDNQVYCWGYGLQSGLGNGANNNSNVPVAVSTSGVLSGKTIKSLSAGANCVIASNDKVYCWGYGANGALGNGATADSNVPVAVLDPS